MKIKYLGTAAAEGIPAIFCQCETCKKARKNKGRDIRTRSQALVDNKILIDFNADTYMHVLDYDIDLSEIEHCIITHAHADHLYPEDFNMRGSNFARFTDVCKVLNVYGSKTVTDSCRNICTVDEAIVAFHTVDAFKSFIVGEYTITPLPALHAEKTGPLMYMIEKDGQILLYAHDTNYFSEEVWEYFEKCSLKFSLVSLDCTEANLPEMPYIGHMNLKDNVKVRKKLIEIGAADKHTVFVSNHFSHNGIGVLYDEFSLKAEKEGFLTSYDGMEIEI